MIALAAALLATQGPAPGLPGYAPLELVEAPAVHSSPERLAAARRARAVWPIANGRVFAYVGLGEPANRLLMITGPRYQTRHNHEPLGAFGEQWFAPVGGGETRLAGWQRWRGVPCAAAAVTTERFAGGGELEVTDWADPRRPVLYRGVRWRPGDGGGALHVLFGDEPGAPSVDGATVRKRYTRRDGESALAARIAGDVRVRAIDSGLAVEPRGGEHECTFTLVVATGEGAGADAELADALAEPASLRAAVGSWRAELFRDTLRVEPAGRLRDLLAAQWTAILAQRSLPGGAVAPMVSFKGVWLRDSNGPLRALLWLGRFDLARAILRYYRAASALAGATRREFPLDLPAADAPVLDAEGWERTGTDRCEVPSFVVLQHRWYFDHTGDRALIREHYPYLRRNALHQVRHEGPHGPLQPFNGDETYLHGAFYSLFPQRGVWPNELPRAGAWSLDSVVTWLAALRAMADLAVVADHAEHRDEYLALAAAVEESWQRHFWIEERGMWAPALAPHTLAPHEAPYAPVSLAPLWLGVTAGDDPRARRHLTAVVRWLGRDDGLCRSTPSVGHFIGSLPAYYLANLAAANAPRAWQTFEAVLANPSASGEWVEVHEPDGLGHGYGDGRYANRLRPWETGLAIDAVLRFLTGAEFEAGRRVTFHPRRPSTTPIERIAPIAVGDSRLELRFDGDRARVTLLGGPGCEVNGEPLAPGGTRWLPIAKPGPPLDAAAERFAAALAPPAAASTLVITGTRGPGGPGEWVLDPGLPFAPADLAAVLFDGDRRRFDRVVIAPDATRADRETLKPPAFWSAPELTAVWRRFEAAGGRVERPLFLTDWWIAGPFPNEDSRGLLGESRPVTAAFDPAQTFEHDRGTAHWRRVRVSGPNVDLHEPGGARDDVCVFARAAFEVGEGRDAVLALGTDDGCRVWLDGRLVFESIAPRALRLDEFDIPLRLEPGGHVLVVGVENRAGAFELAARWR